MTRLETNLARLDAPLANDVRSSRRRDDEIRDTSRDGLPVNGLRRGARTMLFHSRYNATREAERIASGAGDAGFVVVLGAGMGHHIRGLVHGGRTILVVEPDPRLIRSLLEEIDLSDELADHTLDFVTHPDPVALAHAIGERYLPFLHRNLAVVELPGRIQAEPGGMADARSAIGDAVEAITADLAVQSRFGRAWMRNTLLNLPTAKPGTLPDWSDEEVVVAAAGPSLDIASAELRSRSGYDRLLAVDTALPALRARGIEPDLVLTIDCQLASYHHFLSAGSAARAVVAELGVAPSVFATLEYPVAALSDHPLHRLIAALGAGFPSIDARGGNVAQAAVDLAVNAGAASVTLLGADFSYPRGRTYAAGSYIHHFLASRADRLAPLEGAHYAFLTGRPGVRRDPDEPARWVQPLLLSYAKSMEDYLSTVPVPVERVRGDGIPLVVAAGTHAARRTTTPPNTTHRPADLLGELRSALEPVTDPHAFRAMTASGETGVRLVAQAMMPLLTHVRAINANATPHDVLVWGYAFATRCLDAATELITS